MQKSAAIGDGVVKILDMSSWKEVSCEKVEMDMTDRLCAIKWAGDGQLLTVTTGTGAVHNYLGRIAVLNSSYQAHATARQPSISIPILIHVPPFPTAHGPSP